MRKGFIDIHNHCAWDIDDGMESMEDAMISLDLAHKDGIRAIVATPHFVPGTYTKGDVDEINSRIEDLKQLAKDYDIEIYAGAEVFLNHSYLDMIDDNMFNTINNTKYVLVEFDVRKELSSRTESVEDKLYEISVRGYIPVVAHVERYFHGKIDIDRVREWANLGYVIQVNRTSLLGMHGDASKRNAHKLIESGLAHVVASDTHRAVGTRVCLMSDVYDYIEGQYGTDIADVLCVTNPTHIIHGDEVEDIPEQKKSLFKKLFRK